MSRVYKVSSADEIMSVHYGGTHVLHIVNHRPVCAVCARAAFLAGLPVECGEFAEGEPIECEETYIGLDIPYGGCLGMIYSTYGA